MQRAAGLCSHIAEACVSQVTAHVQQMDFAADTHSLDMKGRLSNSKKAARALQER
jgi:hypothetical protein